MIAETVLNVDQFSFDLNGEQGLYFIGLTTESGKQSLVKLIKE